MKASKKSLLASGMSLLASAALLAGATFAWFTDSVTNTGNKIQAGNLAIELWESESDRYSDALTDSPAVTVEGYTTYKNISDANGGIFADALWEPGYTAVKNLAVYNAGSLAVRYQLLLKDVVTTKGIENVLDVYVNDERAGTLAELADSAVSSGVLLAGSADRVQVQVHMQEQAGNAYQEAYASFAIEVFATQYTYETDGFGSDLYDEAAPLPAVHTQYDFDDPAQAVRFCPECQNSGSTAGHADHTQFAAAFEIRDGKAVIRNNTPHIAFNGLDWENSRYTLAYEVDASALSDGARVRFDAGEKTGWQHMFVEVSRNGEMCSVQTSRNTAMVPLGEIADTMQVICTFEKNGSGLAMTVTVTDGTHTYSGRLDSATIGDLYWNVYEVGGTSETYAALDNFKFYATPLRSSAAAADIVAESAEAFDEALAEAKAGDVIAVSGVTYTDPLTVTTPNVVIQGSAGTVFTDKIVVEAEGVTFRGVNFEIPMAAGDSAAPITTGGQDLTLDDCTITRTTEAAQPYAWLVDVGSGVLTAKNTVFTAPYDPETAFSASPSAIRAQGGVYLDGCTIATDGYALFTPWVDKGEIKNTVFTGIDGRPSLGAINNTAFAGLVFDGCTFEMGYNSSVTGGSFTVRNSIIDFTKTPEGGAGNGLNIYNAAGEIVLENNTFIFSRSTQRGINLTWGNGWGGTEWNGKNVAITGNTFTGTGAVAIRVTNVWENVLTAEQYAAVNTLGDSTVVIE